MENEKTSEPSAMLGELMKTMELTEVKTRLEALEAHTRRLLQKPEPAPVGSTDPRPQFWPGQTVFYLDWNADACKFKIKRGVVSTVSFDTYRSDHFRYSLAEGDTYRWGSSLFSTYALAAHHIIDHGTELLLGEGD